MPKAASSADICRSTSPAFFSVHPFLQFIEFIKRLATYLRARGSFAVLVPALQRPRAAAQHFSNATLAEKVSVVNNDLVASGGRRSNARLRIGNRPRHDIRGRLVRLTLVLGFRRPVCNDFC